MLCLCLVVKRLMSSTTTTRRNYRLVTFSQHQRSLITADTSSASHTTSITSATGPDAGAGPTGTDDARSGDSDDDDDDDDDDSDDNDDDVAEMIKSYVKRRRRQSSHNEEPDAVSGLTGSEFDVFEPPPPPTKKQRLHTSISRSVSGSVNIVFTPAYLGQCLGQ